MLRRLCLVVPLLFYPNHVVHAQLVLGAATRDLAAHEEQLLDDEELLVRSLNATIDEIGLQSNAEILTVGLLRSFVGRQRKQAEPLRGATEKFSQSLAGYMESLDATPPKLREQAIEFRRFGEDEEYEHLKTDYTLFADIFEKLAAKIQDRKGTLENDVALIQETLPHLDRTILLLDRVDSALAVVPEELTILESTRSDFDKFRRGFEQLEAVLYKFHGKLTPQDAASPTVKAAVWKGRDPVALASFHQKSSRPAQIVLPLQSEVSQSQIASPEQSFNPLRRDDVTKNASFTQTSSASFRSSPRAAAESLRSAFMGPPYHLRSPVLEELVECLEPFVTHNVSYNRLHLRLESGTADLSQLLESYGRNFAHNEKHKLVRTQRALKTYGPFLVDHGVFRP